MLHTAIITAYKEKVQRGWDTLYFAVDLHGTIIERYTGNEIKPYTHAIETLQKLSSIQHIVLILFTSTSAENLAPFLTWANVHNIRFKYLNENPECKNNATGDFSSKFYFNVLLDDRAGFDPQCPQNDWQELSESIDIALKMCVCAHIETCHYSLKHKYNSMICHTCTNHSCYLKN